MKLNVHHISKVSSQYLLHMTDPALIVMIARKLQYEEKNEREIKKWILLHKLERISLRTPLRNVSKERVDRPKIMDMKIFLEIFHGNSA